MPGVASEVQRRRTFGRCPGWIGSLHHRAGVSRATEWGPGSRTTEVQVTSYSKHSSDVYLGPLFAPTNRPKVHSEQHHRRIHRSHKKHRYCRLPTPQHFLL